MKGNDSERWSNQRSGDARHKFELIQREAERSIIKDDYSDVFGEYGVNTDSVGICVAIARRKLERNIRAQGMAYWWRWLHYEDLKRLWGKGLTGKSRFSDRLMAWNILFKERDNEQES